MKKIVIAMMCLLSVAFAAWEPARALAEDFPPMESVDEDVEIRPEEIVPRFLTVGADRTQAASAFVALTDPNRTDAGQSAIFIGCRTRTSYYEVVTTCCFGWTPTNWGACVTATHRDYGSSYSFRSGRYRCRLQDCMD